MFLNGLRYDELVGNFMAPVGSKGKEKRQDVPCVGISFGIERLFAIMEAKMQVSLVWISIDLGLYTVVHLRLSSCLCALPRLRFSLHPLRRICFKKEWSYARLYGTKDSRSTVLARSMCDPYSKYSLQVEFAYKANPKLLTQLQYCEDRLIPLALIVGERELQEGVVKLRNVKTRAEQVSSQFSCFRVSLVFQLSNVPRWCGGLPNFQDVALSDLVSTLRSALSS